MCRQRQATSRERPATWRQSVATCRQRAQPIDNPQRLAHNLQQPADNAKQPLDNLQQHPDNLQQPRLHLNERAASLHRHPASQPAPEHHTLQNVPLQRSRATRPASTMHPAFLLLRAPYAVAASSQIPAQALPPNLIHPSPLQAPMWNFSDPLHLQMQLQDLTYLHTFGNPNHSPP